VPRRLAPAVLEQARFDRHPRGPALLFEHRLRVERVDVAEAQHGDRFRAGRHAEQRAQRVDVEQRDPAHPEPFGARREPHVLDRARGGCEVHLRQRAAPEHVALAIVGQRDDEQLAAFAHAFDLQSHEFVVAFAERVGGRAPLGVDERVDRVAPCRIGDADEAPRLHEADARRMVCRAQQPCEHGRIDRSRREMAHVAPLEDGAVNGVEGGIVETHDGQRQQRKVGER